MATAPSAKFRIDVDIHNLLMNSASSGPTQRKPRAAHYPTPFFPSTRNC